MVLGSNGLVYVEPARLAQIPFAHLLTALDEGIRYDTSRCGRIAAITGYTEWLSTTDPCLTVGWDWVVDGRAMGACAARTGAPRTNISLLGCNGRPLSWERNLVLLGQQLEAQLPWQDAIRELWMQDASQASIGSHWSGEIVV